MVLSSATSVSRVTSTHLAGLLAEAWKPRLSPENDSSALKKTEEAAKTGQERSDRGQKHPGRAVRMGVEMGWGGGERGVVVEGEGAAGRREERRGATKGKERRPSHFLLLRSGLGFLSRKQPFGRCEGGIRQGTKGQGLLWVACATPVGFASILRHPCREWSPRGMALRLAREHSRRSVTAIRCVRWPSLPATCHCCVRGAAVCAPRPAASCVLCCSKGGGLKRAVRAMLAASLTKP